MVRNSGAGSGTAIAAGFGNRHACDDIVGCGSVNSISFERHVGQVTGRPKNSSGSSLLMRFSGLGLPGWGAGDALCFVDRFADALEWLGQFDVRHEGS